MNDLAVKFKTFKTGTKVTCTVVNFIGGRFEMKGTIIGDIRQNGFLLDSGAWSLYGGLSGGTPCYEAPIRPYGKQKARWFKIGFDLFDVKQGW